MGEPKVYEIREIWDFAKVPDDRLDECLREFALFVRLVAVTETLASLVGDVDGKPSMRVGSQSFTWIDDGLREVKVSVTAKIRTEP